MKSEYQAKEFGTIIPLNEKEMHLIMSALFAAIHISRAEGNEPQTQAYRDLVDKMRGMPKG